MSDWFDTFTREARARDVPAEVIADVTAEVRARCRDGAVDPLEEYGDPALYARAVEETTPVTPVRTRLGGALAPALLAPLTGVIGWQLGSRSVRAALDGSAVEITGGDLVWWAILLVGTAAVVGVVTRLFRNTILLAAFGVAFIGCALLAGLYMQEQIAVVPLIPTVIGAVLFLALSVIIWRRAEALHPADDETLTRIAPWTFPILTALQGLLTWILA